MATMRNLLTLMPSLNWLAGFFFLIQILPGIALGQAQSGLWTAHTSTREIVALTSSSDAVWAATTGGIFSYTWESGEIQRYTAVEGLHNIISEAIVYDPRREVIWVGYRDGVIDRLDPKTGTVQSFFDIARGERSREINKMVLQGDSLLVATSFGLVVFDPIREEVRDSYTQLGTLPPESAVNDVLIAPIPSGGLGFWVATESGLAFAPRAHPNLKDPTAWSVDRSKLPASVVLSLAWYEGSLYAGTTNGLAQRRPDGSYDHLTYTTRPILDLEVLSDRLLAIDIFVLYSVSPSNEWTILASGFDDLTAITYEPDGEVFIADQTRGLQHYERLTVDTRPALIRENIHPDGPYHGRFGDLTVDTDGTLWAGAIRNTDQGGFYRRDVDGHWSDYTSRFLGVLNGRNNYIRVHVDRKKQAWAASYGNGLAQVTPEGEVFAYDEKNSSLGPAAGTAAFVIVGGAATDQAGNLWVSNTTAFSPLHVRTPQGVWTALPPPTCNGFFPTTLSAIFIDSSDQKWIVVLDPGNLQLAQALIVLDTGTTPTDSSDDTCRYFGTPGSGGKGLPNIGITSITEDREGNIWIGTEGGPAYIPHPFSQVAAQDAAAEPVWPVWADRSLGDYALNRLPVHDIAVDPSNRLWMATPEGVYLLEEDASGYQLVNHLTTENSPLFSNEILSIAVDGRHGEVYFATDEGLVSYRSDAVAPSVQVRDLFVFPNPIRISAGVAPEIRIDGLVDETRIHVLTADGSLVAQFDVRGGRAVWDGRDTNNRLVPSGIYLVVAVGQHGEGTAYGKVVVIR